MKFIDLQIQAGIATARINRPGALNALNADVLDDLGALSEQVRAADGPRVLILTGAGEKAFVAGADIKEMESLTPAAALEVAERGQALMQSIEDLPIPVIAMVNGFALGGGLELALSCDFIVASSNAKWGLPEVTLGLIPGYGGTQRLSRQLGRALARRVALSGEIFSAEQGYAWGLFTQVVEPAALGETVTALAQTLALRAPRAMAWVKEAINHGADLPQADGLKLEAKLFSQTFSTEDRTEGVGAFIAKRAPRFRGR